MATELESNQARSMLRRHGDDLPASLRAPLMRVREGTELEGTAADVLQQARRAVGGEETADDEWYTAQLEDIERRYFASIRRPLCYVYRRPTPGAFEAAPAYVVKSKGNHVLTLHWTTGPAGETPGWKVGDGLIHEDWREAVLHWEHDPRSTAAPVS